MPGLEADERVRELYDRVRGAVAKRLAEVVRVVSVEKRRQSGQVKALRRHVDRQSG